MIGDPNLWIPDTELEELLDNGLKGISLTGLPNRTRAKVVKEEICRILGYPVPKSFTKKKPRFPGQDFDVYVQKANNLQIWNEEVSPTRRYVLVRVSQSDLIVRVRVVTGQELALLDTTGTLTSKYQASCTPSTTSAELITAVDTDVLMPIVQENIELKNISTPTKHPQMNELMTIEELYKLLCILIGKSFTNLGSDQERNRGAILHKMVCEVLGYNSYQDNGQFPDVQHQLLEVKLQTSPTIDLGVVRPNSIAVLGVPTIQGQQIRHCDVRYAIFYASINDGVVSITHLILVTGESFFNRFPQMQGNVINRKRQLRLPNDFF
ncbi:hypothetical protein [Deinococcus sp. UYEF24]